VNKGTILLCGRADLTAPHIPQRKKRKDVVKKLGKKY